MTINSNPSNGNPKSGNRMILIVGAVAVIGLCVLVIAVALGVVLVPRLLAGRATPTTAATTTPLPPAATDTVEATIAPTETEAPPPTDTALPTDTVEPTATATGTPPPAGFEFVWPNDNAVVVYVPAGPFLRGSVPGAPALDDEQPQTTVTLNGYWIDKTEVTQGQYKACVLDLVCALPQNPASATVEDYFSNSAYDNHPVIHVIWQDAVSYCEWAGRRLPSEAEWEKAARGEAGGLYPWGEAAPDAVLANFNLTVGDTADAQTYREGASPYGALNLAGNVREWVRDWYDATYYATGPTDNPIGPADPPDLAQQNRVYRGGSWKTPPETLRAAARFSGNAGLFLQDLGFRCAATP